MEKDIYKILLDRLYKAGFVLSSDCELEVNESMQIAGRYALCNRKRSDYFPTVIHTAKIATNLEISFDELEMLLAIAKEEKEAVSVSLIASKYHKSITSVRSICSELKRKGYLDCLESSSFHEGGYAVTNRGMMCLVAEQPIDRLNANLFVKLEHRDMFCPILGDKDPEKNNPIWKSGFGLEDLEEMDLEEMMKTPSLDSTDSREVPFLDYLKGKMDDFRCNNLSIDHLVAQIDTSLKSPNNQRFGDAFRSLGYDKLPDNQKAFLLLLCDHFTRNGTSPMNFTRDASPIDVSPEKFDELSSAAKTLVTTGLVVIPPDDTYANNRDEIVKVRYMLSPDAAGVVFHGMTQYINYDSLCRQADVWKCESIEKKTLLFDGEMLEKVASLHKLIDPANTSTLLGRLAEIGRKSLTCLFYGAPGVGKTELCRQLARSTGRDCIVADPAKLNGSYWGDSEKNAREVFRAYKYLYKISDKAPVLVFNEADGIISKRFTEVNRSIEKSENAVQSIILQELESFEGIFIATTNLQSNLDEAADRRFLYKMRFDFPSEKIREQIICMKMKWISEEDAKALSHEFCLSGGQVDNLASKCIIEKFMTGQEASLEKMRSFCREEISMRTSSLVHRQERIGFVDYSHK